MEAYESKWTLTTFTIEYTIHNIKNRTRLNTRISYGQTHLKHLNIRYFLR
jgi:hypothetical protein